MNEATHSRVMLTQTVGGTESLPVGPPGYDLLDEVGRGGVGVVYVARDLTLGRDVAIKVLLNTYAPESSAARRFVDEACITGQLQHPGIPAVYQVGALSDGRPYLAMKLIKGQTLDALLKAGAAIDVLSVFAAISQAVGYAHAHGVIHRDLKPSNVMVGAFGEVQVMDWGLAKVLTVGRDTERIATGDPEATAAASAVCTERVSETPYTQYGSMLGTPAYMAPEQAAGELDKIDARADVFGLGAILCVLLTGKPPYDGKDAESVRIAAVRGQTADALTRLDSCAADPEVIALCKRCLAFEPADRPATADAVAAEVANLRHAADDRAKQAEQDKLAAEVRAAEQIKRRRALQWASGVVAAVLLLGLVGTGIGLYQANESRKAAVAAEQDANDKRQEAVASRQAEEKQKVLAQTKEAEANAVVTFFVDHVLSAARPKGQDGGLGAAVSLRDAISASLPALGRAFPNQPLVEARLRSTLGATYFQLGEARSAEEQYARARDLFTEKLGADAPTTLRSTHNLANSYASQHRHADALALREQVLTAHRRVLPADHPDILGSMTSLASSYAVLRRHADAQKLFEETLAARQRVLPPDHPDTLGNMNNLAVSYASQGRHADAVKLGEETLAARRRVLPPDHPDTLSSMHNLAVNYASLDRHADALNLRKEALAAQRRVLPPDHPDLLLSLWGVAASLIKLDRGAEAVPLIDECVTRGAGKLVDPRMIPTVMDMRLRHFQKANDPAGCRDTAALWEKLDRRDADSLYNGACCLAVASAIQAKADGADAARLSNVDADRAMTWLTKAIAAGYKDRANMAKDADLDTLRRRDDFKTLLAALSDTTSPKK